MYTLLYTDAKAGWKKARSMHLETRGLAVQAARIIMRTSKKYRCRIAESEHVISASSYSTRMQYKTPTVTNRYRNKTKLTCK